MKPAILYRDSLMDKVERDGMRHAEMRHDTALITSIVNELMDEDSYSSSAFVVSRYRLLPYPAELHAELKSMDATPCQPLGAHTFLADATRWSETLAGLTPPVFGHWHGLEPGAYVLKGKTNSRKQQWNTCMFAPTVDDVPRIAANLLADSFIADQGIIVRPYVPLRQLGEGLNGLPICNEWRFFCWEGSPFASGFYWGSHEELAPCTAAPAEAAELAYRAARYIRDAGRAVRFLVVDVAETAAGEWIVVEVNDGEMSGLACIEPEGFYANLLMCMDETIRELSV